MRRESSLDEIFALIAVQEKVMIRELLQNFRLDIETMRMILEFLIKYNFARFDGRSVMLSEASAPFFARDGKLSELNS